ncbi:LuxR C-terminal-related transcriptional regulator [Pseudomonas sp.]|uniref:LuxR C-terminal-related transcriptional regulator n=1 Tax=Pseudomonas sp. TaxID=306 RepID=UPI0019E2464B|nr:LuxR C-terminal-related transcriptional regulator [Pseudomonas sp.]MBF0673968.1 AAA family ATPase [Pseudomonas sp.]
MTNQISAQSQRLPLLRTKLFPAELEGHSLLSREVLIDRLFQARRFPLLVLSAPAGYGKSTVLSQLRQRLQATGHNVAWLSCDDGDSEPQRLLEYLLAAVESVLPGFGANTAGLLRDGLSWPLEALLEAFITDLRRVEEHIYLILDDVHRIRHPGFGQGVAYLLRNLPEQIHLISSTRFNPQYLTAPGLSERVYWLKAEDLRLSRQETADYFRCIRQQEVSDEELALLHKRTEGWITALHLASLALARHPDRRQFLVELSGTERDIADYLTEDVLEGLPADVRWFLEQTSILDEFCADLCNTLTGHDTGRAMLKRLQAEQLFIIPLDTQGEWFRYHHLFTEFLQGRLVRQGEPAALLLAAARWSETQGYADRAIGYALRARDFAFAADLLERQGIRLVTGNRVYSVLAMLKRVPAEQIREHTVFQLFYAWQLAFEQKFAEAEALIEDVSNRLLQGQGRTMHTGLAELLGAAQVLKALILLYQDKLETSLKVARHWLGVVREGQPFFRASLFCVQAAAYALLGDFAEAAKSIASARTHLNDVDSEYLSVMISLIESLICKEYGELERGRALAEAARKRVDQVFGRHSRVGGPLALAYSDLLYEQDRHAAILAELPRATTWRDVATPVELVNRARLVMAKARFYAGEAEQGLADLDEWLEGLQDPGYQRVFALAMGCKVQFLLWMRRPNEASRACLQLEQHLDKLDPIRYPDAFAALAMAQARLALTEQRPDKAQLALENMLARQTAAHLCDRRLRLSLLLCVAYWRKGNSDKAFLLLRQTVQDAWARGYRRAFLDDALWLLPLWNAWQAREPRTEAWQMLGEMLREQCRRLAVDPLKIDENQDVSHREREILRLVAAGLSNRDIAQAIHLSEATIKWHLHNLFAKFGVRSRTQAVLKGKSLGLLSEA